MAKGSSIRIPARILGHAIHPPLTAIPIVLWIYSLVCDLAYVYGVAEPAFRTMALYAIVGGIAGALMATAPDLIDLLALPASRNRATLWGISSSI